MWGLAEGSREAEVGKDSRAIWQMVDVARWMWGRERESGLCLGLLGGCQYHQSGLEEKTVFRE